MNTRLRLTMLAAVFAFIAPTTSTLHARVLAPKGIEVPDGTRKCMRRQTVRRYLSMWSCRWPA